MLWRNDEMGRNEAYAHMAEWFEVEEPLIHMANADEKMCREIIYRSIQLLNDLRRLDLDFGSEIKTPYYDLID